MNHDCDYCGRNEWIGWIVIDGRRVYYCHRHEAEAKERKNP